MSKAKAGSQYVHYRKNTLYTVIALGVHTETHEELVIYKTSLDSSQVKLWVRPREIFEGKVTFRGKTTDRFTLQNNR